MYKNLSEAAEIDIAAKAAGPQRQPVNSAAQGSGVLI
jgi:hypothetical protein